MEKTPVSAALRADLERLMGMKPWDGARYTFSDVGNGYLFADFFKDTARYAADRGCWYVFTGMRWECDRGGLLVMSLCKRLTHLLSQLVSCIQDEDARQRFATHVMRWRARRTRETALREAAEVYPVRMDVFDRDPMVLNCLNGTLELRSGTLRPHDPADFITRLAGVRYDPEASTKPWEDFVFAVCETDNYMHPERMCDPETGEIDQAATLEAMQRTADKLGYLHRALGYALTGLTHHECLHIIYGSTTRNGKTTLIETIAAMMGEYAVAANPESLAAQSYVSGRGPSEDVARLCGARFVSVAEPDRTLRLSPSLIKQLTGNDTVTCRYLHENSFQYRPRFKLFLNTNYLPHVDDPSVFTSGRIRVIEFQRHFAPQERDPGLKDRLVTPEVLSGVLNWCLKGLQRLDEEGFDPPECILDAVEEYRQEGDVIGQFVSDCLIPQESFRLKTADVYRAYRIWCEENGYPYENSMEFCKMLRTKGQVTRGRIGKSNPTTILIGYTFGQI